MKHIELEVQKFLRNGGTIEKLKEDLGIKSNTIDNLVLLTYSQTDSPKSHPIVLECRGLVLEQGTWDIKSYPFKRFFNYGEMDTKDFDFTNCYVLEKVDGSLITFFFHNDKWYLTTRGTINGTGNVGGFNFTFGELINKTISNQYPDFYEKLNKNFNYTFEFVSPENKVITYYDYRGLYLIGLRNICDYSEMSYQSIISESERLGCYAPKLYHSSDYNAIVNLTSSINATDEGFVCVNYDKHYDSMNFSRVKVKNPSYVALAHIKENSGRSISAIMECVMRGEEKEFLSYFPEYSNYFTPIVEKFSAYKKSVMDDIKVANEKIQALNVTYKDDPKLARKEFSFIAQKMTLPSVMFELYNGNISSFQDWIEKTNKKFGSKYTAKRICEMLKIKDVEFSITE